MSCSRATGRRGQDRSRESWAALQLRHLGVAAVQAAAWWPASPHREQRSTLRQLRSEWYPWHRVHCWILGFRIIARDGREASRRRKERGSSCAKERTTSRSNSAGSECLDQAACTGFIPVAASAASARRASVTSSSCPSKFRSFVGVAARMYVNQVVAGSTRDSNRAAMVGISARSFSASAGPLGMMANPEGVFLTPRMSCFSSPSCSRTAQGLVAAAFDPAAARMKMRSSRFALL